MSQSMDFNFIKTLADNVSVNAVTKVTVDNTSIDLRLRTVKSSR